MSAIRGSTHSKDKGLLPIEPPNIVFRPIDWNPEPIDWNPEDVPIGQRSAWGVPFPDCILHRCSNHFGLLRRCSQRDDHKLIPAVCPAARINWAEPSPS